MFARFFKKEKQNSKLQVGQLLYIHIFDDMMMKDKDVTLKSRIAEIRDEELAIEMPIEEGSGRIRFFPVDTEITADFYEGVGLRYSFYSKVTGKANDNIPLLLITKPSESSITRVQRRDYLRVPINLNLRLSSQNPVDVMEGQTVDLSGGGLSYCLPQAREIQNGQRLTGLITLPAKVGNIEVRFTGKVVRVLGPNEQRTVQFIALYFEEIEERDRERIVRLCIQREMEINKKLNPK